MAIGPFKLCLAPLCALLLAAGCGNQSDQRLLSIDLVRDIFRPAGQVAPLTTEDIRTNLANTSGPLELALREDEKGWAFYLGIESNGGFDTYGNGRRQTMTLYRGIVTATRGLGGDLMSSDIAQTAPLIAQRRAGQGRRIMRFLDGADQTQEIVFDCTVTRGDPAPVDLGEVRASAITMTETCSAGARQITNTYLVDANGRALGSRQWLGDFTGYMLFQTLRR